MRIKLALCLCVLHYLGDNNTCTRYFYLFNFVYMFSSMTFMLSNKDIIILVCFSYSPEKG